MKLRIKKGIGVLLGVMLAAVTCVGILPQMTLTAYAAGTGKNLQMVTSATAANIEGAQVSNVYFGNYYQNSSSSKDPIKWKVLQNSGSRLFLLADKNLDCKKYNETPVTWESCTLRDWLNGTDAYTNNNFINTAFSETEISSIADSSVVNSDNPDYGTSGGNNTTDKVFLLSIAEVRNGTYGFTDDDSRVASNTTYATNQGANGYNGNGFWWLRSSGRDDFLAAIVEDDGNVHTYGFVVDDGGDVVRPAFNLNLSSIIFTSAAEDGKSSGNLGADALTSVADYTGNDWKLTIADSARNGFSASCTNPDALVPGGTAQISYSGALTGTNEYVSAIITDASDTVLYYGNIASCAAASGTASINIPAGAPSGFKLYVFQEKCNGNNKTDYSSALINLTAPASGTASEDYFADLKSAFDYAMALGGNRTVTWNRDCVLNYDIMKLLSENPSITLAFSYTYEDVDYKVTIPGRLAKPDPTIPIYGPLYLYGMYGGTAKPHKP